MKEYYVYKCWACRSDKYVELGSNKETIKTSTFFDDYCSHLPTHQHNWWFAYRMNERHEVNTVNGHAMAKVSEAEQEAFVKAATKEDLQLFENNVNSDQEELQRRAIEMIKNSIRK